jgi:hypothetical protein
MLILISKSPTFESNKSSIIKSGLRCAKYASNQEQNFNFFLRNQDGLIRITVSYGQDVKGVSGFSAFIEIDQSDYTLLKADDLDKDRNATNTFIVRVALIGENKFTVQSWLNERLHGFQEEDETR